MQVSHIIEVRLEGYDLPDFLKSTNREHLIETATEFREPPYIVFVFQDPEKLKDLKKEYKQFKEQK